MPTERVVHESKEFDKKVEALNKTDEVKAAIKRTPDPKLFGKTQFKILFLTKDPENFEDLFEQFKNSTNLRFSCITPSRDSKRKERFDAVFLNFRDESI